MPTAFTIYCCGTGFDRSKNDVVARLNRDTRSPHQIYDGPGSAGLARDLRGNVAGVGVDANVNRAVGDVQREMPSVVNLCGWSRGAVTCFKIANKLFDAAQTKHVQVNIFAIDPVPGGTALNNHMLKDISLASNVVACSVVLAQHDRGYNFAPVYPTTDIPFADVDIMPGDHSTIVQAKGDLTEAHELVYDMAKRFLVLRGTLLPQTFLSGNEVLSRYARIASRFSAYAQSGKDKTSYLTRGLVTESRPILNDQGKPKRKLGGEEFGPPESADAGGVRMLHVKPAFFLNEHHRETCRVEYPSIAAEIDLPPKVAFAEARGAEWRRELAIVRKGASEHADMVMAYMDRIGAQVGRPRSNAVDVQASRHVQPGSPAVGRPRR